jgi:KDO2-lipid IV(A) lauroyltransferase
MSLKGSIAGGLADVVRHTPRSLTEPIAAGLAGLLFATFERRAALATMARAYPDWPASKRVRTTMGAYRQMARGLVEFLHTHRYTDAEILERVELENESALSAGFARGRGVVLLTGHFGNWEWLARRATAGTYPLAVVYKEPKDPEIGDRISALRRAQGFVTIDHEEVRTALEWLKRGGVLGIVMDQEPNRPEEGAIAPLLGRPTVTHVGPFRLARLTGAPVFTAFARRVGPSRYRVRVEPLALSENPDPRQALVEDAAAFNARLEAEIRARPDHWLWMYRRWRRLERSGR